MEVCKTIGMNIKLPIIRFFNACLIFASIGHLIVPTFDTKVTEYLCLGWVFFLQTIFDFLTEHFDRILKYHSKGIFDLSSNLKIYFTCDLFS